MAGSSIYDIDTVGYGEDMGEYLELNVNNMFYLMVPSYYQSLYSIYFKRCLQVYDGWIQSIHNSKSGFVPQKMLQSIATGLNNMIFSKGIDFSGDDKDYEFATNWSKKTNFYSALKKLQKFSIAGGTSLLKVNRKGKDLYCTSHRIDSFYPDIDSTGRITSCRIFYDFMTNTNASQFDTGSQEHYGICEERYFNKQCIPCVKTKVYRCSTFQTSISDRQNATSIEWENLPSQIRNYIKDTHPDIIVGKEQYLPFKDNLGLYLWKFTDDIPQYPTLPFGQPIGDILWTENFQYDQLKYFEKNEVDLARARALVPEQFWNKDDPNQNRTLDERFYQKVSSMNDDDKITPVQFQLRSNDISKSAETIYKDCAFKLNVSASSIATFLSEGSGARTATEIVNERTKTDTWLLSQINLNLPEMNKALKDIMLYYNHRPVELILRTEDQSPYLERLKTMSDALTVGNISPKLFVKSVHKNLSIAEQREEIAYLQEKEMQKATQVSPLKNAWKLKTDDKNRII